MSEFNYPEEHLAFQLFKRNKYGGASISFNSYWKNVLNSDPNLENLVMTVDLFFGVDKQVRIASKAIKTYSDNGSKVHSYVGCLSEEPTIEYSYSLGESSAGAKSLTLSLPCQFVEPLKLVNSGRILAGVGEVSLQLDGGDYDQRIVLLRGDMDNGVSFGNPSGGMLEFSITDPKEAVDLNLAPVEVSRLTFPDHAENASGQRYPLVVGSFDRVPCVWSTLRKDASDNVIEAIALACLDQQFTIPRIYIDGEVVDMSGAYSAIYDHTILEAADGRGRSVTLIRFNVPATFDGSEQIHADIEGGLAGNDLIPAVRFLALNFSLLGFAGINASLFAKAHAKTGVLNFKACANGSGGGSASNTLEYIEGGLLNSFPMVSMVFENGSYGPVVTDRRLSFQILDLVVGQYPLFARASDVQESPKNSVRNKFVLKYNYDPIENIYRSVVVRDPTNSHLCRVSRRQCGERHADPIESITIYEEGVANYVIDWMTDHMTLPSYYLEYHGSAALLLELQRGDNVRLTDPEFEWENETATVEKISYENGLCLVGLRVWWRYYRVSGGAGNTTGTSTITPVYEKPPVDRGG